MASLTMNDMAHLNMHNSIINTIFSKYRSDDALYNIIIMVLITTLFKYFMDTIAAVFVLNNFKHYLKTSYYVFKDYIINKRKASIKEIHIEKTTNQKETNTFYDACDWFISQQCLDTKKESIYNVSYKDDITRITDSKSIKLNKRGDFDTFKEFEFQNLIIHYNITKFLITTYGDQERKKENFSIIFKVFIKNDNDADILDRLCTHILDEYTKYKNPKIWKQEIFVNDPDGKWKNSPSDNTRKLSTICLRRNIREELTEDLEQFINSKEWYNDNGIPYMRGYLLYGPPGTGKTSIIKAISNYTKRHIHYIMFSNIKSDSQLMDLLNVIDFNKTILVIEDVDATIDVIKNRNNENINKKEIQDTIREEIGKLNDIRQSKINRSELTLAGILNALDGVFSMSGRILIMTSNKPDELDKAFIRAGRIDRKIKLEYCDKDQVRKLYKHMFNDYIDESLLIDFEENKYPPALLVSIFMKYVRGSNILTKNIFVNALHDDNIY